MTERYINMDPGSFFPTRHHRPGPSVNQENPLMLTLMASRSIGRGATEPIQ